MSNKSVSPSPDMDIRTEDPHELREHINAGDNTPPLSQFPVPSSQYPIPSSQYTIPSSQYTIPSSQYTIPSSQYTTPSSQFPVPTSQFQPQLSQLPRQPTQYPPPPSQYPPPPLQYLPPQHMSTQQCLPPFQYMPPTHMYQQYYNHPQTYQSQPVHFYNTFPQPPIPQCPKSQRSFSESQKVNVEPSKSTSNNNNNMNLSPSDVSKLLPEFHGTDRDSVERWVNCIDHTQQIYGLGDLILLYAASSKLRGVAKLWFDSVEFSINSWEQFRFQIVREFQSIRDVVDVHRTLTNRHKKFNESYTEYVYEIRRIASEINLDEATIVKYIISGLRDPELTKMLTVQNIFSITELLTRLKCYEKMALQNNSCNRNFNGRGNFEDIRKYRNFDHSTREKRELVCSFCKGKNHYEKDCEVKKEKSVRIIQTLENEYIKIVKINGVESRAFIDLGSDVVTMKRSLACELNLKMVPSQQLLRGFGNSLVRVEWEVEVVVIEVDGIYVNVRVLIVKEEDQVEPLMIGSTALDRDDIAVVKTRGFLKIVKIPESNENEKQSENDYLKFLYNFNTTEESLDVQREKCVVGDLPPKNICRVYTEIADENLDKNININLENNTKFKLKEIIRKYRDCFALNTTEIGKTNKTEIKIKLMDDTPINCHPYRYSVTKNESIKKHIDELVEVGVVKPSVSQYTSPVVVVKKKNGEDRICVDYRRLNSKTVKDRFPLPNIEDLMQRLSNKKYFTVLDMASGYYQIPVAEDSRHLTSFVVHDGQYEFDRMPFGLVNAPAVFQRLINRIVHEMKNKILGYLDDIVIPSTTVEEGLETFEARKTYWWPRMKQMVRRYISTCFECLFHRENRDANRICLHPIEKPPKPCHTWHLDHLGPFIKSTKGNQHILVIVDGFTKYVFLRAVRSTSSKFVINSLSNLASDFGKPLRVVTDRGTAFTSKDFEKFCSDFEIVHVLNATATPRGNGQVERYNRTILHALRTMSEGREREWDKYLQRIQWSLNSSIHSTTKYSPQMLLFGSELRSMFADKLTVALGDENDDMANCKLFDYSQREDIREKASQNIKTDQDKQKIRFDQRHRSPREYSVGDVVVIFREPFSTGESRKLMRRFRGPYTVTEKLYGDRYRVEELTIPTGSRRFKGVVPSENIRLVLPPIEDENALSEHSDD